MEGECFACVSPTTEQYTLSLEDKELEEVYVCDDCIADFRDTNWINVAVVAD